MNTKELNEIAKRLREIRTEKNLSLEELSRRTGLAKSTLQRYETGKIGNIPLSKIEILSNGLNVNPHTILGWSNFEKLNTDIDLSIHEKEIILKYRSLDFRGKAVIDDNLEREYKFCTSKENK